MSNPVLLNTRCSSDENIHKCDLHRAYIHFSDSVAGDQPVEPACIKKSGEAG